MHVLWGTLMAVVGLFMLACGTVKSEFIIYRLMVARSRILWGKGDAVHRFYQVSGVIVMVLRRFMGLGRHLVSWLSLNRPTNRISPPENQ